MPELKPKEKQAIEMADGICDLLLPSRQHTIRHATEPGVTTPGPWRLKPNGDIVAKVDGSEYVICWTDADSCLTEEEQIANGKLIAVSPILSALARDLVSAWDKCDATGLHSLILRAKLALSLMEVK